MSDNVLFLLRDPVHSVCVKRIYTNVLFLVYTLNLFHLVYFAILDSQFYKKKERVRRKYSVDISI